MYSNVFDSVKTGVLDLINFEGLIYSSIISGLHPTLSLNQAIDSTALLSFAQEEDFLKLIQEGYIKIALFGIYSGKKDGVYAFLNDKLSECINQKKVSFKFSSLPFLYNGDYSEPQLVNIYNSMRDILNGEYNYFSFYKRSVLGLSSDSDDIDKIEEYGLSTVN